MRTANDLETLEHQVELAQGDEAKAEALYQVASYQFERSLLFYNPIPWSGIRHYLLDDLNNDGGFRQPGESQLLFDNMQKHDMAANSLPIFLEVARRFPNTRAARDALFSAAVCHERLAEYNNYWRGIYAEGGHAGERMVTYRDVRAAYPKYRFPRGTLGWEPATRTVNRGPAWEPLPKPKPRPSRLARCVDLLNGCMNASFRLLNRIISDIEFTIKQGWLSLVLAAGWVFHWLWVVAMCGWVWFLWRRTREARELMRESLAGCNRRPAEERSNSHGLLEVTTSASVLNRFLHNDLRAEWLENVYDLEYKLRQVLQDKQGLSVVGFYLASHGMFALLLVRLLVNW
jgi:hypothetical protein